MVERTGSGRHGSGMALSMTVCVSVSLLLRVKGRVGGEFLKVKPRLRAL